MGDCVHVYGVLVGVSSRGVVWLMCVFFFLYHVKALVRANMQKHITTQETRGMGEGSTK